MTLSPGWRRFLALLLIAAAFAFMGAEIFRNLDNLQSFHWDVRPALLLISIVTLSAVFLWGVVVWRAVLRRFGLIVQYRPLARAWFLANFSRYIPGMIWQFVSLAHLGSAAGLAPAVAVTSLLVQMGFLLLSAAVLAIYLLPVSLAGDFGELITALRFLAPAAVFLVHPRLIRSGVALAGKLSRRSTASWQGSWSDGLQLLGLSAISWLLYGGAFYLFLNAFVVLPPETLPAVTAMNALSFIAGYLAFFAPGGLGYKEGALAVLLAGLMPRPVAFSLAIAARLWTIAAESIPALFLLRDRGTRGPS